MPSSSNRPKHDFGLGGLSPRLEGLNRVRLQLVIGLEAFVETDDLQRIGFSKRIDQFRRDLLFKADEQCALLNGEHMLPGHLRTCNLGGQRKPALSNNSYSTSSALLASDRWLT